MRGISRLFAALILTASATLGCQAPAASAPAELSELDMTTLRGTFDSVAQWSRGGDRVSWSGIYSEDAVLQPPNAPTVPVARRSSRGARHSRRYACAHPRGCASRDV